MAIYRELNSNLNNVKSLIEDSHFLEAGETVTVTTSGNNMILTITDVSQNKLFEWTYGSASASSTAKGAIKAYADSTNYNTIVTSNPYRFIEGIGCANGIIIKRKAYSSSSNGDMSIRITRTNLGNIAFIFHVGESTEPTNPTGYYTSQCCVAWGDITPLRTLDVSVRSRMQTEIVPLFTNAQLDIVSKTVKSGVIMYSPDYSVNLRYILINGHRFITDGYFAIEDEG